MVSWRAWAAPSITESPTAVTRMSAGTAGAVVAVGPPAGAPVALGTAVVVVTPGGSPATVVVVGLSTSAAWVGRPAGLGVGPAPRKPAAITRIPATSALPATA